MDTQTYRHFFFDFDGVISDSLNVAMTKFNDIRSRHYPQLPAVKEKQDMTVVYGGPLKSCMDHWLGPNGTKQFFNHHSEAMEASAMDVSPFEGIGSVLNALGEANVSIVTSSYSTAVKHILGKVPNLNNRIIHRIAGRELQMNKTEKLQAILNELGINRNDGVYIGDMASDIIYCKEVPMDIVSVTYGYHTADYLKGYNPTYLVNSIAELGQLLTTKLATHTN